MTNHKTLLILILGLLCFSTAGSANILDGLFSYLDFDTLNLINGNFTNLVVENQLWNATLKNGSNTLSGKLLEASLFYVDNSTGIIDLSLPPNQLDRLKYGNWSINYWYKSNSTLWNPINTYAPFGVYCGQPGDTNNYYFVMHEDGLGDSRIGGSIGGDDFSSSTPWDVLNNSGWRMITHIKNNTNYTLYLDGQPLPMKDSDVSSSQLSLGCTNFSLGARFRNDTQAYDAGITASFDELGFWNRTLNTSEITTLYNSGVGVNPFGTASASVVNESLALEGQNITFSLTITNTGGFNTTTSQDTAIFNHNRTNYTAILSSSTAVTRTYTYDILAPEIFNSTWTFDMINWTWHYNVSEYNGSVNGNYSDYNVMLTTCGGLTNTTGINMSVKNETSSALVEGTGTGWFEISYDDVTATKEYNLSWTNRNNFSICLYPPWENYTINHGQIEYTATGYNANTYYFTDHNLDNNTEALNIFLTSSSITTTTSIIVTDEDDNPLSGLHVHVLAYDVGTDSYITSEILVTGFSGVAVANLIYGSQYYKFLVYDGTDLVFESSETIILSSPVYLRINFGINYFEGFDIVMDTNCRTTFNNATNTFAFTWTGLTAVNGTLTVTRHSMYSQETVFSNTSVSTVSGVMYYTIATPLNLTYMGQGFITTSAGETLPCGVLASHDFKDGTWKTFGDEGLMMTFLITLTLVMIALWSPSMAVIIAIVGISFSIFLGIFHLSVGVWVGLLIIGGVVVYRLAKK